MIDRKNDAEAIIYLKNGSVYQLKGGDDPDRLRGPGPLGAVFDEFGTMKLEAWQVVEPALSANNGWAWFIGTPKGKNHLYEFYHRGQGRMNGWDSWLLTGDTSGIYTKEKLDALKLSMTQKMFQQEIMCNFLENEGTVFRGVRNAMTSQPEPPKPEHFYVMGVDLAKVTDFTVLTVYDRIKNNQVYQDRFQTLEWPYQKAKIATIAKHFNNALVILDATGLGDPIADDLIRAGVAVQPFKITEQTKKDIIEKLSIWIEQQKCTLLPITETIQEFDNFSYEIGATGKIRYQAREGFHDDIVLSHALAISGLAEIPRYVITPDQSPLQKAYREAVSRIQHPREDTDW